MTDGMNSGNGMGMISEHDVTRLMAGNVESARQRLVIALEQLGYRVMSENPLRARHGARGGAVYYMSANALEYPTRLEISLKPQGAGATQVTFDYQVQHGAFGKGDRQTLTREAEALIALASQRAQALNCAGCGVEVAADSRFCRKCGAPIRSTAPAELEVMRLTAGTRGGYQWTWIGISLLFFGWLFPLVAVLKDAPKLMIAWAFFSAVGAWALGAGLRRIHFTLNPKEDKEELQLPTYSPATIATPITNELPQQQSAYRSITEGTTDLLPVLDEVDPMLARSPKERSQA
ncbi:MAG: zinc ribbon domain-containing protein [Blastocatellia bacterium]|nr:zinc ribbon domain-containing protein [Blastocatellia bacterium]